MGVECWQRGDLAKTSCYSEQQSYEREAGSGRSEPTNLENESWSGTKLPCPPTPETGSLLSALTLHCSIESLQQADLNGVSVTSSPDDLTWWVSISKNKFILYEKIECFFSSSSSSSFFFLLLFSSSSFSSSSSPPPPSASFLLLKESGQVECDGVYF